MLSSAQDPELSLSLMMTMAERLPSSRWELWPPSASSTNAAYVHASPWPWPWPFSWGGLDSRVVVEQAKGIVTDQAGVNMDKAFKLLRDHARSHNHRLGDVVAEVIRH